MRGDNSYAHHGVDVDAGEPHPTKGSEHDCWLTKARQAAYRSRWRSSAPRPTSPRICKS